MNQKDRDQQFKKLKEQGVTPANKLAEADRKTLKKKGIKSPDLNKLIRFNHGKQTYFCHDEDQLKRLKERLGVAC